MQSNKAVVAKYQFLYKMLLEFQFTGDQLYRAADFSAQGASHSSHDVRTPAYECMCELYKIMGEQQLKKYIDRLRPAQQEALLAKFAEVGAGDQGGDHRPVKQPRKDAARSDSNQRNASKPGKPGPKAAVKRLTKGRQQEEAAHDDFGS